MIGFRRRRLEVLGDRAAVRTAWQCASLLLSYPDEQVRAALPTIRDAAAGLPEAYGRPLGRLADWLLATPGADVTYVETFDHTRKCSLYLTYFTCGDTRKRGVALVRMKQSYRASGVEVNDDELPDHLAVLLEFGATVDADAAYRMLVENRVGIEMVRLALEKRRSPWADALTAICATLPALDGTGTDALRTLLAQGPPAEEVGLEPYGADPHLSSYHHDHALVGGRS
jgi:nitrate reductase delta subunit